MPKHEAVPCRPKRSFIKAERLWIELSGKPRDIVSGDFDFAASVSRTKVQIIEPPIVATPPTIPSQLFLNERVEHCGPLAFEISISLEAVFEQSFDSLERLRPG